MKPRIHSFCSFVLLLAAFLLLIPVRIEVPTLNIDEAHLPKLEESFADRAQNSKDRQEHFFRLQRSPHTNKIPANIRQKELAHAQSIVHVSKTKENQQSSSAAVSWVEAGPNDVGGRTRAFAIDSRNSNILIAGGVSGGMWKSTDGGSTWSQKTTTGQSLAVTAVAQDPLNLDTWFYTTGEFSGNSARARGGRASYFGSGIYISTNNGESWSQIQATEDNNVSFDSEFDFISNVAISPTTGTKFFASNAVGIYRSTNNFQSSSLVLGGFNAHRFSDVIAASDGTLYAYISNPFNGISQTNSTGIYISQDDGQTWQGFTPGGITTDYSRGVLAVAPSNPDIVYLFVTNPNSEPELYRFDLTNFPTISTSNRTSGIPDFGEPVGDMNLQGGYNMVVAVHPTDPNFVIIGGTNLYRSTDGFSSTPPDVDMDGITDDSAKNTYWVGGYASVNNISQYSSHHPDQHGFAFDPSNSNRFFSSHDGGISVTSNITSQPVTWTELNNGYNVTQFYTVALHPSSNDNRILGGTQDNGSPLFEYNTTTGITSPSDDISSGDGSYAFVGTAYALTSSQRGRLIKYEYAPLTESFINFSFVAPISANNQLFIHPFAVNPTSDNFVMYPDGAELWRNNQMRTVPRNTAEPSGTSTGWTKINANSGAGVNHLISTLEFSSTNPSNRFYYGASAGNDTPRIFRLDNANTSNLAATDISITALNSSTVPPSGAYIHDIAVNSSDGSELLVIVSNYETESIYHSLDAGATWTAVGGNLEPQDNNGPSVRNAVIVTGNDDLKLYLVGTSTGLYSTSTLNGSNTVWSKEGQNSIGNTVVEFLAYRDSDKRVAVGTHGRGIFVGDASAAVSNEEENPNGLPVSYSLAQNYPNPFNPSTTISYSLPAASTVSLAVYDINGRKVAELLNKTTQKAGTQQISFDAGNLASGVYLYRINAISQNGGQLFSKTRRMTLIK